MKNRFYAASTLVFALVCVSDPALSFQQRAQPQECGNLTQYIPRLAQEFGWTREQAIGALANFAHESRGRAIEQVGMPAGAGGFGWAQWTGARRAAFMAFARANGMSPATDAANYAFLAHELRTTFAHVAQRMRSARSAADATVIFARDYEGAFGPGAITAMASRHQWARALGAMPGAPTLAAAAAPIAAVVQPAVVATAAPVAVAATRTAKGGVAAAPVRTWYVSTAGRPAIVTPQAQRWYAIRAVRPGVAALATRPWYGRQVQRQFVATTSRPWSFAGRQGAAVPTQPRWRGAIAAVARPGNLARAASLRSGYYGYWVAAR